MTLYNIFSSLYRLFDTIREIWSLMGPSWPWVCVRVFVCGGRRDRKACCHSAWQITILIFIIKGYGRINNSPGSCLRKPNGIWKLTLTSTQHWNTHTHKKRVTYTQARINKEWIKIVTTKTRSVYDSHITWQRL